MNKKLQIIAICISLLTPLSGGAQEYSFSQEEVRKIASIVVERDSYRDQLGISDSIISTLSKKEALSDSIIALKDIQLDSQDKIIGEQEKQISKLMRTKKFLKIVAGILGITTVVGLWI